MNYDDNEALSLARYQRAARFPVMPPPPPAVILLAYEAEIQTFLDGLHPKIDDLKPALRQLIKSAINHMMMLPASSSHHHRTNGGLFYHSFEVALLAWQYASERGTVRDAIAAFVAGLLHDIGKTLSLFNVFKLSPIDPLRTNMEQTLPTGPNWIPAECNLAQWCAEEDVEFLALRFRFRPQIGHMTLGVKLWRDLVPSELISYIAKDKALLEDLTDYLDGDHKTSFIRSAVSTADRESVERDLNPGIRTAPKRTELHMARRFIEFQYFSPWNAYSAPFALADIYLGDEHTPLEQSFPFFVATPDNIRRYLAYVYAEDFYGHLTPENQGNYVLYTLESLGVLRRTLPGLYSLDREANPLAYRAPFFACLEFEGGAKTEQPVPLCYFPHIANELPAYLPRVRAIFNVHQE